MRVNFTRRTDRKWYILMNKLKRILKILLFIIVAVAAIGFVIIPFLYRSVNHMLAQYLWYPSLGIIIIGNIILSIIDRKINRIRYL